MTKNIVPSVSLSDIDAFWSKEHGTHLLILKNVNSNRVAAQLADKTKSHWLLPCHTKCKTVSEAKEAVFAQLLSESSNVYDELNSRLSCTGTLAGKHITVAQQRIINHALKATALDALGQELGNTDFIEECEVKSHSEIDSDALFQITHGNVRMTMLPFQIRLDDSVFGTVISNHTLGYSMKIERLQDGCWEHTSNLLTSHLKSLELADIETAAEYAVEQIQMQIKPTPPVYETQAATADRVLGKTLSVY